MPSCASEGAYHCSTRTMYRLLAENNEVRERRDQLRHPAYARPELFGHGAKAEVWSWDITKLLGPAKWTYYYLYVILDIFSRYVVGWMLALAGRPRAWPRADHRDLRQAGHLAGAPHDPRGPRLVHEGQGVVALLRLARGHQGTAARTSPMTTPTPRPSSRPSSTAQTFLTASAPTRTAVGFCHAFFG